mmetsp:Transcript_20097/g.29542  ORF Transcript_20097/g.29542 Transcript_20097/m.29542 type:complete len:380 (-) Transcript_20097:361-1500(-)
MATAMGDNSMHHMQQQQQYQQQYQQQHQQMQHQQMQQQQMQQQQPQQQQQQESRPISVDTQHDDMVHDAKLDYYGCKLATSSSDRTVKIFDVAGDQYTHTATLQGHEGPVWEVAWAHPKFGVVLASCSFDGTVLIHRERSPHSWTLLHTHRLHESSVNGVEFAPHEFGLIAAAASSDGRVSVLTHQEDDTWSTAHFRDNALGVNAVSWAPYNCLGSSPPQPIQTQQEGDGEQLQQVVAAPQLRLVTGGCDNRIRFWRLTESGWGEEPDVIGDAVRHTDWVRDVAWAPSTTPVNIVASCSEDRTVIVWTQTEAGGLWQPILLHTFDAPVWRVSWSITGNILAVSSGDNSVTLWKASLDGTWSQVSTVDDVAASSAQQPAN